LNKHVLSKHHRKETQGENLNDPKSSAYLKDLKFGLRHYWHLILWKNILISVFCNEGGFNFVKVFKDKTKSASLIW